MSQVSRGNKKDKQTVFTRETLGVALVLFCTLCLICLITREKVFSVPGQYINAFLLGVAGYFSYLAAVFGIVEGVLLITDKKTGLSVKYKLLISALVICLAVFMHLISMGSGGEEGYGSYGRYLSLSYTRGEGGAATSSAGGVLAGLIAYPFYALMTQVGACVVVGALFALCAYLLIADIVKSEKFRKPAPAPKLRSSYVPEEETSLPEGVTLSGERDYPVEGVELRDSRPTQRLFVTNPEDFKTKTKKEMAKKEGDAAIKLGFGKNGLGVAQSEQTYSSANTDDLKKKLEYIKTPATINWEEKAAAISAGSGGTRVSQPIKPAPQRQVSRTEEKTSSAAEIPFYEHDGNKMMKDDAAGHSISFRDKYARDDYSSARPVSEQPKENFRERESFSEGGFNSAGSEKKVAEEGAVSGSRAAQGQTEHTESGRFSENRTSGRTRSFFEEIKGEETKPAEEKAEEQELPPVSSIMRDRNAGRILFGEEEPREENAALAAEAAGREPSELPGELPGRAERAFGRDRGISRGFGESRTQAIAHEEPPAEKPAKPAPPINREYFRPPLDLLESYAPPVDGPTENHEERMEIIKQTLEDFHINALPQSYVQGPSITRYEIMMPPGISVKKVLNYDEDLRMRLASKSGVRIEAPIPGKNLVGVEVANKNKVTVGLREVIEGSAGKKQKPGSLVFAIGKDIVGNAITDNLAKGPHFLVAGATGSGKSVCLNVMIVSLIMRYSPEELRLILIDPKRVGFRNYEHIPHLLIDEIVTEPQKAVAVLQWAYNEMERRYDEFAKCNGVISDIEAYNELIASDTVPKMPRIVIIVDELADLMETCKKDMEAKIRALAQKARAAGVHLVLATQRPSVDIITGTIKANLPSRIALKVMNFADSQTILAEGGAEKLLGNGDMLYKNSSMAEPERYQGAWISDREINNVVTYIKEHNAAYFDDELKEFLEQSVRPRQDDAEGDSGRDDDGDGVDELFLKALWLAVNSGTVSISQLQRRFQIGYARAGGLVDKMERMGFVSANEGSKARRVLISREEFEERFGPMTDTY